MLAGGVGGAKASHGFALASAAEVGHGGDPLELTVIVNTGDDLELNGLYVAPDLDTVMYTLAGVADPERGWGLRDETWSAATMLATLGAPTWFRLGDRDLAVHVLRTQALRAGRRLTDVTAELCARLAVSARVLPMSDDQVRTQIRTPDGWLEFQDYFVRRGQRDEVLEVRHRGASEARPTPEVLAAVAAADLVVVAPSNPFVSIGTILALPGMLAALTALAVPIVAVSPIVGGRALKGPADRMLVSLGGRATAEGVVEAYEGRWPGLVDTWVLDEEDADEAERLRASGRPVLVTGTVMRSDDDRRRLAESILGLRGPTGLRPSPGGPP